MAYYHVAAVLKPLMEHNIDHLILQAAAITGQLAAIVGTQYIESHYFKTPYHTSILSGQGWVQELLNSVTD